MSLDISKFLTKIKREPKQIELLTDEELIALPVGTPMVFDVETYINFFLVGFKLVGSNKYVFFEQSDWAELNTSKLSWLLHKVLLIGFNSINYDLPIIYYALQGATNAQLKHASDTIVEEKLKYFAFEQRFKVTVPPSINQIDLIEVAPLSGSLKLYGARLHSKRLQELPYPPSWRMDAQSAQDTRDYNVNDLELTELLYTTLQPELNLRIEMSNQYQVDLRSKSDAQIAEAVICSELHRLTGKYPRKPNLDSVSSVKYQVPDFIKFSSPELTKIANDLAAAEFPLTAIGKPAWPEGLGVFEKDKEGGEEKWQIKVKIGDTVYKVGMGGLHSQESEVCHIADENTILVDRDVASYYPNIVLNQELFPQHLGRSFLEVYKLLVTRRLDAKRNGDKTVANTLKIVLNGTFGKLGERFSKIYSPQLLLQVTITGQLALLMLIERMEASGIPVVSGNTDGIIMKYNKDLHDISLAVIKQWEIDTNFETEETRYKAVYSRDVNNYIAVKYENDPKSKFLDDRLGCKTKGVFAERGSALNSVLSKNPEGLVMTDAVLEYIVNKKPVAKTIKECNDFRRFVSIRNAKGGAYKGGDYLGKLVRWYYGKGEKEAINYVGSGNQVANTVGAVPAMDLPDQMPTDIDYDYYIQKANETLYQLKAKQDPKNVSLF